MIPSTTESYNRWNGLKTFAASPFNLDKFILKRLRRKKKEQYLFILLQEA